MFWLGLGVGVELARGVDELLEVLLAALRLDRALGLERVEVAGVVEQRLEQVRDRDVLLGEVAERRHRLHEDPERAHRRLAEARHRAGVGGGLPDRDPHRRGVADDVREGLVADPATRGADDPRERDDVLRVAEHREIGDRVLDLRALVELRPADDLVVDRTAHERVLDEPRLRVHPVEDRDLRAARPLVDETLDLADDVARLRVLVVELADLDLLPVAGLGPQRFGLLRAVVRDEGVCRAQNRLRRAVVLLELDDLCVRERVLEVKDVADVGSAEAINRVVRYEAFRHEVVRPFDVEVVDGAVELHALDAGDRVEAAALIEHHHSGTNRSGRGERQRVALRRLAVVASKPGDRGEGHVEHSADAIGHVQHASCVGETALVPPTAAAGLGGTDREPNALKGKAAFFVVAVHAQPMHWSPTASVPAEARDEPPATTAVRLRCVVRPCPTQPFVFEERQATSFGVDSREHAIDQRLVAHEAVVALGLARYERQRRQAVAQRQQRLGGPRFRVARMR